MRNELVLRHNEFVAVGFAGAKPNFYINFAFAINEINLNLHT